MPLILYGVLFVYILVGYRQITLSVDIAVIHCVLFIVSDRH